jgi:hypothetical protein
MQKFMTCSLLLAAAWFQDVCATRATAAAPAPAEKKRVRRASAPPVKQNTHRAPRMKKNPTIDADWNKKAWQEIPPVSLDYYMGDEPAHQPLVQVRIAYDDDALYLIWKVEDNFILAKRTKNQGEVWKDSCVEFFFTPGRDPGERGYFNLETNCIGAKLLGPHIPGKPEVEPTAADFAAIASASSLKGPIEREITRPTTWTLEYRIPLALLEKYAKIDRPQPGVTWRGNFYKCADDASHPHWLTWSPVNHPEPSFHLPEFFGVITFE